MFVANHVIIPFGPRIEPASCSVRGTESRTQARAELRPASEPSTEGAGAASVSGPGLDFPTGKYSAILADPPWRFECWSEKGTARAADNHYDTQEIEWIAGLPVAAVAADDCVLFIWATWPLLPEALRVIEAWGFTYKTEAFSWVKVLPDCPRKPKIGLGYWTRANTEPCLLATKGHPKRIHADVGQVIAAPIREHSRKPDETHERIERLVAGPYLELFARQSRPGWTVFGNEANKFDESTLFDTDGPQ